jgi:hypothetical protein
MTTLDQIYLLTHLMTYKGQEIMNVYFYNHTSGAGGSGILCAGFDDQMMPLLRAVQSADIYHKQISAYSLGDLSDFANLSLAGTGDYEVEALPPTDALGFTYKVNTRAVRPGSKRICGIPETVTTSGEILDPTYLGKVEALRLQMVDDVTGIADAFSPVIVKRIKTPIAGTVPLQYNYRLPAVGDTLTLGGVTDVLFNVFVTTQVSRKRKSV